LDNYNEEIMDYLKDTYAESLFDIWNEATSEDDDEDEDEY
jgi:hypothetical protein